MVHEVSTIFRGDGLVIYGVEGDPFAAHHNVRHARFVGFELADTTTIAAWSYPYKVEKRNLSNVIGISGAKAEKSLEGITCVKDKNERA